MTAETIQLVVLAAVAVVVLVQLYNVLGKRVGRQPEDVKEGEKRMSLPGLRKPEPNKPEAPADPLHQAAAALRQRDPNFDTVKFLEGAKTAYETIVKAYAAGDRPALQGLLAKPVMDAFEAGMADREARGRTEQVEFLHQTRADAEAIEADGDLGRVKVRFLGELRTRSKGPEGEAVDDRRTAEVWTFERPLASRDPNWTLVRVEAAEG